MEKKKAFWSTFGKFSAVVGVILVIVQIWNTLLPSSPRIVVTGYYNSIETPPDHTMVFDKLDSFTQEPYLRSYLTSLCDPNDSNSLNLAKEISKAICGELENIWGDGYSRKIREYSEYINLKVKNKGSQPANNIFIDIPFDGLAYIYSYDGRTHAVSFNQQLSLGELRPDRIIEVSIWTNRSMYRYTEKDFRVSHEKGKGSISFGRTLFGPEKLLGLSFYPIFFLLVSILLAIVLRYIGSSLENYFSKKKKKNEESSKKDIEHTS